MITIPAIDWSPMLRFIFDVILVILASVGFGLFMRSKTNPLSHLWKVIYAPINDIGDILTVGFTFGLYAKVLTKVLHNRYKFDEWLV